MTYFQMLWIIGGLITVGGIALLVAARTSDARNYIIQKATPLPLSLVNERDDVWLRGSTDCEYALLAPHFEIACLHYEYKLEERVTRTRQGKDGKTKTETRWVTRDQRIDSRDFDLLDDGKSIRVRGDQAEWRDLKHESDRMGKWRHTLEYLPYPARVSAVGSVSEGKRFLEPFANIPLLVTLRKRDDFVKKAERGESMLRFFGYLLLWLGVGVTTYGLFDRLAWPVVTLGQFQWATLIAAAGAATVVHTITWTFYLYNTFVLYRMRVENAWRQIDVDLKMRYDLVPNLVRTLKGYMDHEKDLLTHTATLRNRTSEKGANERISAEAELTGSVRRLIGTVENYPDLDAQPLVHQLMEQIKALEEKIAHGRTFYNLTVKEYNDHVMTFPRSLVARISGFSIKPHFEG